MLVAVVWVAAVVVAFVELDWTTETMPECERVSAISTTLVGHRERDYLGQWY